MTRPPAFQFIMLAKTGIERPQTDVCSAYRR